MSAAAAPPVGLVALLFTDIEGSTAWARRLGSQWSDVLQVHHEILSGAIRAQGGHVDGTEGDAFFATFSAPVAAGAAAVAAQRELARRLPELRVRMGLHVGHVERGPTGYVGLEVHRAARVGAAAHGGQLLLTAAARELIGEAVPVEFIGAHRLKDFPTPVQLYCAVIDGRGAAAFPPPRAYDVRPTNLPAGGPDLVGREQELRSVRAALLGEGERLLTLSGRGGTGKTSLALLAGAELLEQHPGGVWWVPLAAIGGPAEAMNAIAAAVGADREVHLSAADAIVGRLRGAGPTLIILDNLEHLLALAPELEGLLGALPELRLLATSQVPTRLASERVILLDPLDEDSGVALIERVAARRGARVGGERAALLEVVRLLDGLPLALELAAARLALLSPSALHERLTASFDLLKDAAGRRPERQRSLTATVQWTLELLDEPAQELFTRLGVFAGPVELEEIELVCGGDGLDVLEALSTLLEVALVRRIEVGDGRLRLGLPEALRRIAARRLEATPAASRWRRRHAERQLALTSPNLFGTVEALAAALAAGEEVTAALRWAREHDRALADRIAAPRGALLASRGRLREAVAVLGPLRTEPPEDPEARLQALSAQCLLHTVTGEHEAALRCGEQAVRIEGPPLVRCVAVMSRANALTFSGRIAEAVEAHHQATEMARELPPTILAGALMMEAQALVSAGRLEEAERALEEGRRVGEASGASAVQHIDTQLGDLAVAQGRPADALEPYARSLLSAELAGDALQVAFDLTGMAVALAQLGRDEAAIEVQAMGRRQAEELGEGVGGLTEHLLGPEPVHAAQRRLDPDRGQAARARGESVPAGQRVARACTLARAEAHVCSSLPQSSERR